ncbi:MAG: hypothetical protein M1598_02520, partial [Actinobacteria bacterium]|nr:hypothetical protein [Actinomycetota bacterium]
ARVALTSGLDPRVSKVEIVRAWQRIFRDPPQIPFRTARDGPVLKNVQQGLGTGRLVGKWGEPTYGSG